MRRHGQLELILVLPDGSKSLIPAAWTDLATTAALPTGTMKTLASVRQLLRARALVDVLLLKRDANRKDGGNGS